VAVRTLEEIWPVFGLQVTAGPLQLTPIHDQDIPALVALAEQGIHDPTAMPFLVPWSTAPANELGRNMAAYYWRARAEFGPARWDLLLAARWDGVVVGVQGVHTADYLVTRTAETGSWLGRAHQGRGVGTLMRQTICALLFDNLDAQEATSGAFEDNPASLAVSRKVGYSDNGVFRMQRREGEMVLLLRLRLRPEALVRSDHPVTVEGALPLRQLIGLDG
jgi:RimJ/RimL family protein N-acetyltransferase